MTAYIKPLLENDTQIVRLKDVAPKGITFQVVERLGKVFETFNFLQ